MTTEELAEDLKVMVEADIQHLMRALERGDRALAHGFVDAIINNRRQMEDLSVDN